MKEWALRLHVKIAMTSGFSGMYGKFEWPDKWIGNFKGWESDEVACSEVTGLQFESSLHILNNGSQHEPQDGLCFHDKVVKHTCSQCTNVGTIVSRVDYVVHSLTSLVRHFSLICLKSHLYTCMKHASWLRGWNVKHCAVPTTTNDSPPRLWKITGVTERAASLSPEK